jgi:Rps23 Pro-64 3,4-dihydroxylase Tpa1-like proline 4-hydroxylase/glycosyltransferase involved in cell wall biosynthesis
MSKYPFVYFLRDQQFADIDTFFEENKEKLACTIEIISPSEIYKLQNMFDTDHHIVITYGPDETLYINSVMSQIVDRMRNRWIHKKEITNVEEFNCNVNYCYIDNVIMKRELTRPKFSIFTSCYKSYEKINRAYDGMKSQTLRDWEWILLDDSPEDEHFDFLRKLAKKDKRIRLYKRDSNSGNIGNVKNETVGLCRGKYVLELDHDDILLPTILQDAYNIFESDEDIDFVFADFANVYENWANFSYGGNICKGYGGYYRQKYNGRWLHVYCCPGINNITVSHLVALPNHPRMWRRKFLMEIENYSEFLPICDDFEILLRTMTRAKKIVKLHKLGYIQFMNNDNNNFSLIRNEEINRLGPQWIQPLFFNTYKVNEVMKEKGAHEDEKYLFQEFTRIWKRTDWEHKVCSTTVNPDFDKQYCLMGLKSLYGTEIKELYQNPRNDFILLDNEYDINYVIEEIEKLGYTRMKCNALNPTTTTDIEMENYFHLICKYTDNYEIIKEKVFRYRHSIINKFLKNKESYLEIGVEYGTSFKNINIENKVGVDPDPKFEDDRLVKKTSDDFFESNDKTFDVIFIDGMHQSDYVLRDFNNAIDCLNDSGIIFLDDILPINEREQHKIPIKHAYENGILKYREPWTGDVWKVVYYLLKNYNNKMLFDVFTHPNYRGVGKFEFIEKVKISPDDINEIENYTYTNDFEDYYNLLTKRDEYADINSEQITSYSESFSSSLPFNYLVLDNFIEKALLEKVTEEIKNIHEDNWCYSYVNGLPDVTKNKYCIGDGDEFGTITSKLIDYFNSKEFVHWISNVTGIKGLQPDNFNMGGGLHKTKKDGHLNIHCDFNRHLESGKYRRINLLMYLNKDYKEEYNGHLELWNKDMTSCEKKIAPIFNRAVIMRTTDDGFHGHIAPWKSDDDRLSIAMYYYTDDRPEHEKSNVTSAIWQDPKII